jgi:3-oxoacyl-[acyl-carrier-protein] synthase-3
LAGTGSYLPQKRVLNSELSQFPLGAIPLIEVKTGVKSRHFADPSEATSDLAAKAASACLKDAGVSVADVDGIILATSSPDRSIPATATRVQMLLGATSAFACDVNAVCSGAVYAIHLADGLIRSGMNRTVLVIAAEIYSRILNPKDFSTYPYFGDGAGAVLLTGSEKEDGPRVLRTILKADGAGSDLIQVPAGGTMMPYSALSTPNQIFFAMNGRAVFEFAVSKGAAVIEEMLQAADLKRTQIAHVILHQANINIVNRIAELTNISRERFYVNLDEIGNTAGASVLIALDQLRKSGKSRAGDLAVVVAFGGGLSWGCSLVSL